MKLKGAIIGCGFFSHNHMYAWKEIKNVEIVAACDLDKKKVSDFSNKFQLANHYTNIDDLLNEEKLLSCGINEINESIDANITKRGV